MAKETDLPTGAEVIPVWDLFVRVFHWSLALCILIAMVTGFLLGSEWVDVHVYAATSATALIFLRVLWGFFGSGYARFSSFVFSPKTIIAHAKSLATGRAKRYIGHNPLGGTMILALITNIAMLGLTGAMVLGGILKLGPFAFVTSYAIGGAFKELHEMFANFLLFLVIGHIGGIVFETFHGKDNLVPAMVSGKKSAREGDVTSPAKPARRMVMITLSALGLALAVTSVNALSARRPAKMPVAQYNPLVADECSACHMLYHPSLMPAQSWETLTAELDNHFREDASLDEESTREIEQWLVANAAESADTKAAHVFPRELHDGTYGLTNTRFWKRVHQELSDSVFASPKVRSKSNCAACHQDAESGMFSPFSIEIPKQ